MQPGRDLAWDEAVADSPGELPPLEVDSEHPYLLTYTSGTTGKPKGIVHVHGGFLVSIAREVAYQADAHPDDGMHFVTDMGWIMGPWEVVGGGALGCTIVLAEGAPDWPAPTGSGARRAGARHDPRLLADADPRADPARREPVERHDLSSLRVIVTTGEPWNPEPYCGSTSRSAAARCPIINCSGGTEVGACFLSPTPAGPIKACSLGGPALGMAMDVVDAEGRSVRGRGRRARLPQAVPRDDARVLARSGALPRDLLEPASRACGCTATGPRSTRTASGSCTAAPTTRSTSRASGIGPAELESAAVGHPAVAEAAAVGVPHEVKGEVAWVFCVLAPGVEPTRELADELAGAGRGRPGQGVPARPGRVRAGAAEDAQREDRAARRPCEGARHRPRRPVVAREPRVARGDRAAVCTV